MEKSPCKIGVKFSPKKPSYKKIKWNVKNGKIAYVTPTGIVTPRKKGTTTVIGKTKDGTNKQVKIKVEIKQSKVGPTATPNFLPEDTRKKTMVEDFESYPVGTKWKITKGEQYKNANCATATVVTDPANPKNKLLKIAYDGNTQAYDVAPIFSVDLTKLPECNDSTTLESFVGINFKTKVESEGADAQYKGVYAFFDEYGAINENYYNATSQTKTDANYKFKTGVNMIKGKDEDFTDPVTKKKYNYKNFPMFYSKFATDKNDCSAGYSNVKNDKNLKLMQHIVDFQTANMKDAITKKSLLTLNKVDFTLGSTYSGAYKNAEFVSLYIDDIQFLSETQTRDITGINITNTPAKLGTGIAYPLRTTLVPENTTQKKLTWSTSDENIAKVDKDTGIVTGVAPGTVTITVSSVEKPAVKKSVSITIYEAGMATENRVIDLSKVTTTDDKAAPKLFSEAETTYDEAKGELKINYTENNQSIVIDLGENVDFTPYKSLEIKGACAGQLSLELYDDKLDKSADKWYEQYEGATYPFFGGSCTTRLEDGAYNTNAVDLTTETLLYSWDKLTDSGSSDKAGCDFTSIRYIVLKTNQPPAHPSDYGENNYTIKGITLSTKVAPEQYLPVDITALNEAAATSKNKVAANNTYTSATFDKDEKENPFVTFVSNSKRTSGIAFYLDSVKKEDAVTTEGNKVNVKHNAAMDISGYRYVKVKVKVDSLADKLSVVGLTDGADWSSAVTYKSESNVTKGERTIYFSLKEQTEEALSAVDAIGIKSALNGSNITICSLELVQGEPLIADADKDTTFVIK